LSTTSGERVVRFALNLSVGAIITFALIGPIELSALGLMIFALSLPAAFVLDFLGNFLIGLGAFWLEDTSGLMLIYSRLGMILGGMLIPLELFPESIQPVLKVLPFSSIVYGPAHLFVHADLAELGFLLLRQGSAILVLAAAVILIYRNALSRVYANGG
jgi:ABC-2 type transport system permease protein